MPLEGKKGYRAFDVRLDERFTVIHQLQERFPLIVLCRVFNVHRSSYRYWLAYKDDIDLDREALKKRVSDAFKMSIGSAGGRSIAKMITNDAVPLSRYRASKLMAELD